MLKRRLENLKKRTQAEETRWLRSLTDEELRAVAGPTSPEEQEFLASLTNAQLADCAAGRVSLGEYEEWRESWALKNTLIA